MIILSAQDFFFIDDGMPESEFHVFKITFGFINDVQIRFRHIRTCPGSPVRCIEIEIFDFHHKTVHTLPAEIVFYRSLNSLFIGPHDIGDHE